MCRQWNRYPGLVSPYQQSGPGLVSAYQQLAPNLCELFIRSGVSCGRKQQQWTWNGWTVSKSFFLLRNNFNFFCTPGSVSPHHPACTVIHSRAVTFLLTKMRDKDLPTKEFQMVAAAKKILNVIKFWLVQLGDRLMRILGEEALARLPTVVPGKVAK